MDFSQLVPVIVGGLIAIFGGILTLVVGYVFQQVQEKAKTKKDLKFRRLDKIDDLQAHCVELNNVLSEISNNAFEGKVLSPTQILGKISALVNAYASELAPQVRTVHENIAPYMGSYHEIARTVVEREHSLKLADLALEQGDIEAAKKQKSVMEEKSRLFDEQLKVAKGSVIPAIEAIATLERAVANYSGQLQS